MRTIQAFAQHLAGRRSAPRTISTYVTITEAFSKFIESDLLQPPTTSQVESFLARPRRDGVPRAPSAYNQALAALRAFARFAARDLGWSFDPTAGLAFVREPERDPAVLTIGEVRTLFMTAAATARVHEQARDLAILALLSQTGLRVHELVALNVDQVDVASATLVGVRGKGGTQHDIALNTPAVALLTTWIGVRHDRAPEREPALFLSSQRKRLSIRSVEHLFQRLRRAMASSKKITPHTLRHTCATISISLGTDLVTVAGILRHLDLNTTRRYIHLVDTQRREAVARLATTVPAELLPTVSDAYPAPTPTPASSGASPGVSEQRVSPRSNASCAEENLDDNEEGSDGSNAGRWSQKVIQSSVEGATRQVRQDQVDRGRGGISSGASNTPC
jgi:integrase/recombinase XerC